MALQLKIEVDLEGTGKAKSGLAEIEQGIKKVEKAAKDTKDPISQTTQALTNLSQGQNNLAASSAKATGNLEFGTKAYFDHRRAIVDAQIASDKMAIAQETLAGRIGIVSSAAGVSTAGLTALGAAIGAVVVAGVAWTALLVSAAKHYYDTSAATKDSRDELDKLSKSYETFQNIVGGAIVGEGFSIARPVHALNNALVVAGVLIAARIKEMEFWINMTTGGGLQMFRNLTNDQLPGIAGNTQSGAGLLMWQNSVKSASQFDSTSATMASQLFEASERERLKANQEAVKTMQAMQKFYASLGQSWVPGLPGAIPGLQVPVPNQEQIALMLGQYKSGLGVTGGAGGMGESVDLPLWVKALAKSTTTLDDYIRADAAIDSRRRLSSLFGGFGGAEGFGGGLANTILGSMTGGGSMLGGIGSYVGGGLGGGLAKMLTTGVGAIGGFAGGALNAILPGIGSLLGPLLSGIGKLFGPTDYEKNARQAQTDLTGLRTQLSTLFGSDTNAIRELAWASGVSVGNAFGAVGGGREFGVRDDMATLLDQLQSKAPQALNDLVSAALTSGKAISPALQPFIEQLIRAGGLTQDNANLLRGLPADGVPAFHDVEEAAKRYGIQIDSLGGAVRQLDINEQMDQAVRDFALFERAGADSTAVVMGMKDEVQGFLDTAYRIGGTIPESMRPLMQRMVDLGLLTDVTGDKMDDLDDVQFAKTIGESVDDLVDALRDLVGILRGDLPSAIDVVNGKEVTVDVKRRFTDESAHEPEPDAAATGGYLWQGHVYPYGGSFRHGGPVGNEFLIRAHSGEFVMNRAAVNRIGVGNLSAMNRGQGAGITVNVDLRDSVISDDAGVQRLTQRIGDELTRQASLHGRMRAFIS
jgi:hypothetical protein